ncbi:MAG: O-antigen ligase family protein, partial [Planctomycetota bacterium]
AIAGSLSVVAIGLVRGGLPGSSLNFRWNYWQVTSRIVADHVWTGVGALNFDHAYMSYKPIEYPEEISDPHNFFLALTSQWGILGAAGLILALVGVSIVAARIWGQRGESDHAKPMPTEPWGFAAIIWIMALMAGYVIVRVWVLRDYLSGGQAGQSFLFFDIGMYGVIWAFFVTGIIWLFSRYGSTESRDDKWRLACLCGIVVFILQNVIDYSMFYSGTLTLLAAISAVLIARRQLPATSPTQLVGGLLTCGVAVIGMIYVSSVMVIPVTYVGYGLGFARGHATTLSADIDSHNTISMHYQKAAEADPIDPTPLAELAGWRLQQVQILHLNGTSMDRNTAVDYLTLALSDVSSAIDRDCSQISLYRLQSWLFKTRFDLTQSKEDLLSAIDSARQVLNLYPVSPNGHLFLADMLAYGASKLASAELTSQARLHYQQALDQDAARPGTDEVRRWYAAKRERVVEKLKALGQHTDRPASGPNTSNKNQ